MPSPSSGTNGSTRETHDTFEAYCRERWGFSRQRAHQIVEAAKVAEVLSTIVNTRLPTNEAQARELVSVLREHGPPTQMGAQGSMSRSLARPDARTLARTRLAMV